jgi:hypothetical protein
MNFMPSRLRGGDRLVGVGAVALVLAMFLCQWFAINVPALILAFVNARHASTSVNAWHALQGIRWLLLFTAIASAALLVLRGSGAKSVLPGLGVLVLALLSTALLFNRMLLNHPFARAEVKLGAWLGLASCAAIAVGAIIGLTDEGDAHAELARARAAEEMPAGSETPLAPL